MEAAWKSAACPPSWKYGHRAFWRANRSKYTPLWCCVPENEGVSRFTSNIISRHVLIEPFLGRIYCYSKIPIRAYFRVFHIKYSSAQICSILKDHPVHIHFQFYAPKRFSSAGLSKYSHRKTQSTSTVGQGRVRLAVSTVLTVCHPQPARLNHSRPLHPVIGR